MEGKRENGERGVEKEGRMREEGKEREREREREREGEGEREGEREGEGWNKRSLMKHGISLQFGTVPTMYMYCRIVNRLTTTISVNISLQLILIFFRPLLKFATEYLPFLVTSSEINLDVHTTNMSNSEFLTY